MRGKKPKERQRYVLRVNETLVEVTRDVYLAWYQSRRKERYQLEKMQKNGVCGIRKSRRNELQQLFAYIITRRNSHQGVRNTRAAGSTEIFV